MDSVRSRGHAGWLAILLASIAVGGCGSSSAASGHSVRAKAGHLEGLVLAPSKPAPPLELHNYTGQPVSLASLRGEAVLVTFVYTHCTDVCPLIVANLAAAQRELGGEARHVKILAVTVDPRRDTPIAIRKFLGARDATGRMDYLLGTMRQLRRTWKDWDVAVNVDTKDATTGHTAIVYGVSASGRVEVVYPGNFKPAQIVHDVPLLTRA